jgi:hypothetical protein
MLFPQRPVHPAPGLDPQLLEFTDHARTLSLSHNKETSALIHTAIVRESKKIERLRTSHTPSLSPFRCIPAKFQKTGFLLIQTEAKL